VKNINACLVLIVIVVASVGLTLDVMISNTHALILRSHNEQIATQKDNL